MIANAVNRVHEFIACMPVELASIRGRNESGGLTPGADIADRFEQFVVGYRFLATKNRVRQVKHDMAADEVAGFPRGDDLFEIHSNHLKVESGVT
jgi:hypothetical protein